jgi:hypothetical protein
MPCLFVMVPFCQLTKMYFFEVENATPFSQGAILPVNKLHFLPENFRAMPFCQLKTYIGNDIICKFCKLV